MQWNREAALKQLRPHQTEHPDAWRRFFKEAQVSTPPNCATKSDDAHSAPA
jgi:hypothetical protein